MKNAKKKLSLKKETLRSLSGKSLQQANGGWGGFYPSVNCFSTESDTKCGGGAA